MTYMVIESNEQLRTMRYVCGGPFREEQDAVDRALERMGDPARKRSFYALLVESSDGNRREIVRGTSTPKEAI